jgi:hypothetical protein
MPLLSKLVTYRGACVLFCAALLPLTSSAAAVDPGELARVVHVVDGDTLDILAGTKRIRVRLSEIDAPENGQSFGLRSRQSLVSIWAESSRRSSQPARIVTGACSGVFSVTAQTPTLSRCASEWRGYSTAIQDPTLPSIRSRMRHVPHAVDSGRKLSQWRRGSGAGPGALLFSKPLIRSAPKPPREACLKRLSEPSINA